MQCHLWTYANNTGGVPGAQLLKNLPAIQETWVWSLAWEDTLEKGKAPHSSILAWKSPWAVHGVSKSQTQLRDFTYGFCGPEISKKLGSKLCLDVSREAAIRYRMDLHSSENLTGNGGSTSEVAHSPNLQIGVGYGWSSFSTWITPHGLGLCKTW